MRVAVAIITDDEHRVLVTQRPYHASHGGFWEFPGGKIEEHETPDEAVKREIKEELGIDISHVEFVDLIQHKYADKSVELFVFKVGQYIGVPQCLVGQLDMQWMRPAEIQQDKFPEANRAIFELMS